MDLIGFLRKKEWPSWTPGLVAILGALFYLTQALIYAHTTIPGLDEGSYIFKGYSYLRGVYEPFEPYGPLTNKAPFAFLIPGFFQFLLGPGLRTGRYVAVFLGLLTVFGTWISAHRWGGKWIAAATVWVFALSPMVIKIHAITASEVIIACMLAWICVFVLGEQRPLWQIILGSILASVTVLTRQNMVFVLPLLILYVFWQHGKQKGFWSLVAGAVVFLAVHIHYWPNILTIWAPWLPDNLTPFLDAFRLPKDATPVWDPSIDFWNRTLAFFQGIRYHFIPAVGSIFAVMLWSRSREWSSTSAVRAAVFLAVLYFILFAMHSWAAVASQYESYSCVYCFTPYLTFFDPLGILLVVVSLSSWKRQPSLLIQIALVLLALVLAIGIGFSLFESIGSEILGLPVPRIREGQFLPGTTMLVDLIKNKFSFTLPWIKRSISATLGLLAGLGLLFIVFIFWSRTRKPGETPGFSFLLANSFLVFGLLLSPILNAGGSQVDCKENVIAANEQLGHYLASIIPAGSLVYWEGGLSFTPMVYVTGVRIFPPQINDGYTYRTGGDPETLFRLSHWNSELSLRWKAAADVFIIESTRYSSWKDFLNPLKFAEYQRPLTAPSCNEGAGLRIFHRLP